jgi:hypothetical protein
MSGDVIEIFDLHFGVPVLFRVQNHVRAILAGTEAHIRFNLDIAQSFIGDTFLQLDHELLGTPGFAIDILANETHSAHRFLLWPYLLAYNARCNRLRI